MNILWNPNEAVDLIEMPLPLITEGTQDMGDGVYWLKAGTPLDEYFAVANDEDAKYVVAEDFYFISSKPDQAKVVPLITAGYVDINKAEKAAGITYSQDCIDALADFGIVLVDGTLPSSGGGGGGALVANVTVTRGSGGAVTYTLDKTWREIKEAAETQPVLILENEDDVLSQNLLSSVGSEDGSHYVWASGINAKMETNSQDGYPTGTFYE